MNCAADFVYFHDSDSEEELEMDNLAYSDCEDDDNDDDENDDMDFSEDKPIANKKKTAKIMKADTNVIALDLGDNLAKVTKVLTGDPTFCKECEACFSIESKVTKESNDESGDESSFWTCEFCNTKQEIFIDEDEIPTNDTTDYLINDEVNPSSSSSSLRTSTDGATNNSTIFCIDTSGSMCVTTEVSNSQKLKGFEKLQQRMRDLNPNNEDQYLPSQNRNTTYISRLQCVQAAIDNQLEKIEQQRKKVIDVAPTNKSCVGIVTFSNEVNIVADGSQITVAGDKLSNYDELVKIGNETELSTDITENCQKLRDHIYTLEENGATALGPAMLISIAIAAKQGGGKVVLCTDGLANIGLGSLDTEDTKINLKEENKQLDETAAFYDKVGQFATQYGVTVSVISITGTDCKLEYLGQVANKTAGKLEIVDPLNLTNQFASVLADPVIATNVSVNFRLHKGLYSRDILEGGDTTDVSQITRPIGNVTSDCTTTFSYGVKREKRNELAENLTQLPFQVQIRFCRKSDGAHLLRVITKSQKITKDRMQAEQTANLSVLGTHAAQSAANFAMQGSYTTARSSAFTNKLLLKRCAKSSQQQEVYNNWKSNISKMDGILSKAQKTDCLSDSESGSDEECEQLFNSNNNNNNYNFSAQAIPEMQEKPLIDAQPKAKKRSKKLKLRKQARSDKTAQTLYKFAASNNNTWTPKEKE